MVFWYGINFGKGEAGDLFFRGFVYDEPELRGNPTARCDGVQCLLMALNM